MKRHEVTPEDLKGVVDYDPNTGLFRWTKPRETTKGPSRKPTPLSTENRFGYLNGGVCGHVFMASRVAWACHYGKWPEGQIDHINGDRKDNRIENLRDVPVAINHQNKSRRNNATNPERGIYIQPRCNKKFAVRVTAFGTRHQKYFYTIDEARAYRDNIYAANGFTERHGT